MRKTIRRFPHTRGGEPWDQFNDEAVDFSHIYDLAEDLYCQDNGRASIDPVVLFMCVLIQHLYGISSLRRAMAEIDMNIAYRWFPDMLAMTSFRISRPLAITSAIGSTRKPLRRCFAGYCGRQTKRAI